MSNNSIGLSISHFTLNNMKIEDFLEKVESISNNYKDLIDYRLDIKITNNKSSWPLAAEQPDNIDILNIDINQLYDYIFESISPASGQTIY